MELVRTLSIIDLEDRDPIAGGMANRILRMLFERIEIQPDRTATLHPRPIVWELES